MIFTERNQQQFTPLGFLHLQLLHTTKNFLWMVLFKCHVVYCFYSFLFLFFFGVSKPRLFVYLRTLQEWVFKDPRVDSGVWKNALLIRHLVHSPKGNFLVLRCIGKPKGAHFYQTKAKHLHCMCQTEHLVHMLKVYGYPKNELFSGKRCYSCSSASRALVQFTL